MLLIIYGSTSVGATVHMHYCMNEFVGWNFWHAGKESKCSKCGMKEKEGGCCKDEHKQLKLSTDQNYNQLKAYVSEQFSIAAIPIYQYSASPTQTALVALTYPRTNAPPQWRTIPLYLSNRVLTI